MYVGEKEGVDEDLDAFLYTERTWTKIYARPVTRKVYGIYIVYNVYVYICIHTHTHTHIRAYTYMYVYSVCVRKVPRRVHPIYIV